MIAINELSYGVEFDKGGEIDYNDAIGFNMVL
jgi:hypothetical protein